MASSSSRGDCFKSFLAERKAEYRSKFPFLTESQIVAKLKRLWNNQQARDARATAIKSHAADAKSECCNSSYDGGSSSTGDRCSTEVDRAGQPVLMSSKGLPGETLRRKVKPPSLSRRLNRFAASTTTSTHSTTVTTLTPHHSHPHPHHHLPPSPTNKENTSLPTDSSTTTNPNSNSNNSNSNSNSSSSLQAVGLGGASFSPTGSPALDCYAFTEEDEQQLQQVTHAKSSCSYNARSEGGGNSSRLGKQHKQQRLLTTAQPPVSLSTNTESDQNITELKSSKQGSSSGSSYGSNLKVATQLPKFNDSASLHASNKPKSKQVNKKPRGAATHVQRGGGRTTRSSMRNAVAAATNYHHQTTTTTTMNSDSGSTTGGGVVVISAASASAGCPDIREELYSPSTQAVISGEDMKGGSLPLSDHHGAFDDSDPGLDREMARNNTDRQLYTCTGEQQQQQEQRHALQPVASAIVDVDRDDECCTMVRSSVYRESQIMGLALRSSDQTQGNVETGGPLAGLNEHSYGHNINTTINTESTDAADLAVSGVSSTLGDNPKTDSKPTQTGDSASGSCPLQSREPATCVHNGSCESAEVVSSICDDAGADVGGTGLITGGRKRGRGRGRGRGKGRKRGRKKKDPNESWIRTNSQPQTCDPVGGDLLEFSQTDQISSSLPERTTAQEDVTLEGSSLPNMVASNESITGGSENERVTDLGTRASFRGRGRRGVRGGGRGQRGRGTMETGTIRRRVVTRSRTAILLKCNTIMEKAEDREMINFTLELENANLSTSLSPPPPAKKQKQTFPWNEDSPSVSGESKAECSGGDNGVTIMDISASSRANAVCGANDGVALSGAGVANNVCSEPRDSSTASTASVNSNDDSSKHTPTLTISRLTSCGESIAFQTPSLQCHTTASMSTTTSTTTADAGAGSTGAAEGGAGTGMVSSSSGKPCKSSSPSPPFAQCSSSSATVTPQPQAQQPSMQLTPIQVDPLCDMFLPLTPERKRNDIYKDIGSFYSKAPTERRTVLPALAGSEDNGYCLFADDADIFL